MPTCHSIKSRGRRFVSIRDEWNTDDLQFSLHLSMAQDCMAIFERDKLPVAAAVEQASVCTTSFPSDQGCVELCDRADGRGDPAAGKGPADQPELCESPL